MTKWDGWSVCANSTECVSGSGGTPKELAVAPRINCMTERGEWEVMDISRVVLGGSRMGDFSGMAHWLYTPIDQRMRCPFLCYRVDVALMKFLYLFSRLWTESLRTAVNHLQFGLLTARRPAPWFTPLSDEPVLRFQTNSTVMLSIHRRSTAASFGSSRENECEEPIPSTYFPSSIPQLPMLF